MFRILISAALVLIGLILATFGRLWGPFVFDWTASSGFGEWLDVFVPFLPLPFVLAGAIVHARRNSG